MTVDNRLRQVALGETGFERAAVWSVVGFAASYVAFDAAAGLAAVTGTTSAFGGFAPVGAVLAALTAVGTVAFAAVGAGVLPAVLLAYGPFAAVFLRSFGPAPYAIPADDLLAFAFAASDPLGVAIAAAVAVGVAGYVVGRLIAGVWRQEADDTDREPASTDSGGDADASD